MSSYYVCTYGNFPEREDLVKKSLEDGCYYLHKAARYPSAIDMIQKGDQLLLNAWGSTLASGCAESGVEVLSSDEWKYRIRVDKWECYDSLNPLHGYSAYGIQDATLIGGQFSLVKKVDSKWAVRQLSEMKLLEGMDMMRRDCFQLGLADIASWYYDEIVNNSCVEAGVPILQRGLVWTAQQDELLWDSLMRKIPIGALVLCPVIKEQARGEARTHHIIDGQQRTNAIAEGFDGAPFAQEGVARPNKRVLWLDLMPDEPLLRNTSRKYLLRVATPAHPWGYEVTDETGSAACLDCNAIRQAKDVQKNELAGVSPVDGALRPHTSEMYPFCAKLPIPVGFMTRAYLDLDERKDDESLYWKNVAMRLEESYFPFVHLKQRLLQFVQSDENEQVALRHKAFIGIQNALQYVVVAVTTPKEVIDGARDSDGRDSIEHMFTRINRQGTRLDGEELIYSSIKSYWPQIQGRIDEAASCRMPPSRLLRLALQVVESDRDRRYKNAVSLREVRRIAEDSSGRGKDAERFIDIELRQLCQHVDTWLERKNVSGLPRVLRAAIAHNAPELYVLLLLLARHDEGSCISREFVVALSLYLYFFDYRKRNSRRVRVIESVVSACFAKGFSQEVIIGSVRSCQGVDSGDQWLLPLVDFSDPKITEAFEAVGFSCDMMSEDLPWWECFGRFRCSREMLLFAEADYLERVFPEYDPARKELWAEYNRPWDYDHVVPQVVVNKWNEQGANGWWLWCMGNMAAIPLEENRSKNKNPSWHHYDEHQILDVEALKVFVNESVDLMAFRRCVWQRFQRIYGRLYRDISAFFTEGDK